MFFFLGRENVEVSELLDFLEWIYFLNFNVVRSLMNLEKWTKLVQLKETLVPRGSANWQSKSQEITLTHPQNRSHSSHTLTSSLISCHVHDLTVIQTYLSLSIISLSAKLIFLTVSLPLSTTYPLCLTYSCNFVTSVSFTAVSYTHLTLPTIYSV